MHLIQARILSRKKLYPQGKKIYEKLVKQYPSSLDIHADYAEILLAYGEYEMAMKEIQYVLNQNPNHLRGLRLQAAFYDHLNLPSWSFTTYQRLLDQYPNDSGILFDYASQRSNAGHWHKALNAYSHVLETAPDNIYALRATHNILRERRPAINTQFVLHEGSDGTNRIHQQYSWRKTLTKQLTFRGIIDAISLQTPDTLSIDSNSIQQHTIEFQMEMYPHLQMTGGIFHYAGAGSELSFYGKLIYHWMPDLESQIVILRQTPWFDPVQATTDDGSYDECQIAVAKTILSTYRLNTIVVYRRYALNRMGHYGKRLGWHMDISRQVLIQPNTTFQLAMDQASFSYNTENRSVPMVPEETTYSISTYTQGQPLSSLTYVLSAGYRWDPRRSLAGFF
ncbi:MAG: TPR repeat containing protein [Candidatus Magnetoglobus multicellularis str. Araruama]|uniref:TPR repeat containing protein n=1 Tax=Candidatus Magnetoglobus multicellularis str. Araruama TaxID=890399 RepID=A0A1V1PCS5_9BACT|nr:MAG: TPR repeat containing protein [Candidatus Magnetoglobus multicellularis str. Araruama]